MSALSDSNTPFCETDIAGEGCGQEFPRKTSVGLCTKCHALATEVNPEKKEQIKNASQCEICGVFFMTMQLQEHQCGCCKKSVPLDVSQSTINNIRASKEAERGNVNEDFAVDAYYTIWEGIEAPPLTMENDWEAFETILSHFIDERIQSKEMT